MSRGVVQRLEDGRWELMAELRRTPAVAATPPAHDFVPETDSLVLWF